jgi:hypothetical protein
VRSGAAKVEETQVCDENAACFSYALASLADPIAYLPHKSERSENIAAEIEQRSRRAIASSDSQVVGKDDPPHWTP